MSHGLPDRFAKYYVPEPNSGCWLWTGYADKGGYGRFKVGDRSREAHRVSWEIEHGSVQDGLCVLHRCDTRSCVNPDHLFLGTKGDNNADMKAKGRARSPHTGQTHCLRGHEFTAENTYWRGAKRDCRTCIREHNERWNREHRDHLTAMQRQRRHARG